MAKDSKKSEPDARFASIASDPRFKLPRKKAIRGDVDDRFKTALNTDKRFTKHAPIDKYGRKVKAKNIKKELSHYYNFEEEGEGEDSARDAAVRLNEGPESESELSDAESALASKQAESDLSGSESSSDSEDSSDSSQERRQRPQLSMRQLMRGEGLDSDASSSESEADYDSDSDASSYESQEEEVHDGQLDQGEPIPQGDETKRLAVVNLDWDNVTATDLMAAFSSFVPANHRIISVKILPSEYGKKQMQAEELHGPAQELFDTKVSASEKQKKKPNDVQVDEDNDYSSSHLRKYQLQRLRYYYAVVECDSVRTAAAIYQSCDGTEYESTANFFDLRFIPDDVDFSTDEPRDESFKVPASYQPSNFTTDALQHSKVKLTWDETPKERARIAQKAFSRKDAEDQDIRAYLASDSDASENEEDVAAKYRALLGKGREAEAGVPGGVDAGGAGDDDDDAVEITFNPVLDGKEATLEVVGGNPGASDANPEDNLSTIEKYRLKEKQRRIRRMENYKARKAAEADVQEATESSNKADLELLAMDDDLLADAGALAGADSPASTKHTKAGSAKEQRKLTKRAAKKKAQAEAEASFDTQDPRFSALFEDPDFAIDSTVPQFKKTKGMEEIMNERRRRQNSAGPKERRSKRSERADDGESLTQLAAKLRRKNQI